MDFSDVIRNQVSEKQTLLPGPELLLHVLVLMEPENPSYNESFEKMTTSTELPAWQMAWTKYATAIGLLKQGDEKRTVAMLKLADVAANHGTTHPWLAGASMIALSEVMDEIGNAKASANIRTEIKRVFPVHPLLTNKDRMRDQRKEK